ncbi:MAG: gamma carbonic anhydrase family protein [Bacteroidales bacterium]|nr:gamma carbonic anhydrase family protein [Bacteroidales bacterium]
MALIKTLPGFTPSFGKNCYLSENATIIGDVITGDDCSIWFNAVLRGDVNPIRIGNRVNIQDGCMLHTLHKKSVVEIGDNVTIGHNAIIHGAKIEKNVLIGMGAIILDHSIIKENSIVAAGALVLEHTVVESGWIYGGVPAKKLKELDTKAIERMILKSAENYLKYVEWYK